MLVLLVILSRYATVTDHMQEFLMALQKVIVMGQILPSGMTLVMALVRVPVAGRKWGFAGHHWEIFATVSCTFNPSMLVYFTLVPGILINRQKEKGQRWAHRLESCWWWWLHFSLF